MSGHFHFSQSLYLLVPLLAMTADSAHAQSDEIRQTSPLIHGENPNNDREPKLDDTTVGKFWNWFSQEKGRFENITPANRDQLLSNFGTHLHRCHEGLGFQISDEVEEGSRELIITANGERELFAVAEQLVAAAPKIPGWTVIPLIPPRGFKFTHAQDGMTINAEQIEFYPMFSDEFPDTLGLRIGIPGVDTVRAREMKGVIALILHEGLGEKLYGERIYLVETVGLPADAKIEGYAEIDLLPAYVQAFVNSRTKPRPPQE